MFNCWPMPFVYDGRQQQSRIIYYHYQQSISFLLLFFSKQYIRPGADFVLVNSLVSNRIPSSTFPLPYLSIHPETTLKQYIPSSLVFLYTQNFRLELFQARMLADSFSVCRSAFPLIKGKAE